MRKLIQGLLVIALLAYECGCTISDSVDTDDPPQSHCVSEAVENTSDKTTYNYILDDEYTAEIVVSIRDGINKLCITIYDKDGNVVQEMEELPQVGCLYSFCNFRYEDLNGDGLNDILVEYEFMVGIGAEGSIPRLAETKFVRQGGNSSAWSLVNE